MNGSEGVFRYGMLMFVFLLSIALAVPEEAYAIGCGGGLFGGAARRQSRRYARSESRQARFGAAGCSGSSQVQYVPAYQAPLYQAPSKQVPIQQAPPEKATPTKVEKEYPQAGTSLTEHYVSMETPSVDLSWDKVPEYGKVIDVPHW